MNRESNLIETFEKNSSELYWLAFLLTGNTDRGVQAFDRALGFAEGENPVFVRFMSAWARKLVIVEALGTIKKELQLSMQRTARVAGDEKLTDKPAWKQRPAITRNDFEEAVLAIDPFPRCAMLLTIFEGVSIQAASILLHADEALTAAAQRIGIVQLTSVLAGNPGRNPYRDRSPVSVLSLS